MSQTAVITAKKFKFKDPGSAITHLIGAVAALFAAMPLLMRTASLFPDKVHVISMSIFIISMILLYSASTIYHSLNLSENSNRILRKLDHCMIFVLIAGSYTPICLIALHGSTGNLLFAIVWGIALVGIIVKICWITCPKWFSSVIYIGMGWVCVLAIVPIISSLSTAAFAWLVAGGIIYTIGGVIYALKLSFFNTKHKNFGSHEIFHLFVLGGSICHFILMYVYIAAMAI